jgi:ABC-type Fe3+ transport system permease subunit
MATAESSIGRPAERVGGRPSHGLRLETLLPTGLTVLVALLVLYPLGMVVFGTFWSAAPGQPGTLTLENWQSVLGDPATFEVLLTSLASPFRAPCSRCLAFCLVHRAPRQAPARGPSRLHVLPA